MAANKPPAETAEVIKRLEKEYPGASIALRQSNPLELLVATILSAQATDVGVNKVTPGLFAKYRTAADYANADREQFEREIRSTGFYRNKAKNIINAARTLLDNFGGQVPRRKWGRFSNLLIDHGRAVCTARKPRCDNCLLNDICPSAFTF